MKIAIGTDHAGFHLKDRVAAEVQSLGYEVIDCGAYDGQSSDYPDFARRVSEKILSGRADRGILICGSGVGASVAANKIPGIRAGLCHDTFSAHQGVEHDQMNILCLGARVIGEEMAAELVRTFLQAAFRGEKRHVRRLEKISGIEADVQDGLFENLGDPDEDACEDEG